MTWGEEFFRGGWKGQPWVVIDRKRACETEEELYAVLEASRQTEGWVLGLSEDTVIHAPTFGVTASEEAQRRIVSGLEAYPLRRALEFEQFERPRYEEFGWPPQVIARMTPRADAQLKAEDFRWPILSTTENGLVFLGSVATWDVLLGALTRCDVPIDRSAALHILLTAHGDPGEKYEETAFSAPFHPKEFRKLAARLRHRSPSDPRGELLRVLADQVPQVVESLRKKPPPESRAHVVGRRRLATAGSNALWPDRRRRASGHAREDSDEKLRRELRALSAEQRRRLDALLARAPLQKALLGWVEGGGWSIAWWRARRGGRATSTLGRMRQEILGKVALVKP